MKNRTISFFFRLAEARLKQDGQDAQDKQDDSTSPPKTRLQVREDLNVYSISRNKITRSDSTLICPAAAATHARDRPSHYGGRGCVFFVVRGGCPPQSLPHPGHPANPGHPASDVIDIKVFQTFSPCSCCLIFNILHILAILQILLQTPERWRGTGPRTTGTGAVFLVGRGPVPRRAFSASEAGWPGCAG